MTGQQVLDALNGLTKEQLEMDLLVEGEEGWAYDSVRVELANVKDGEIRSDTEDIASNCIIIRNNW